MRYPVIVPGRFICRPNRFIAQVEVDGREETVHVKNTGRCRELLVPGCRVYLAMADNPARRTRYDLVTVEKERPHGAPLLINMDSQAANDIAAEWLPRSGWFSPDALLRREVRWGDSRFDFCITQGETRTYLEVKGVTLERDGVVMFPDAPTQRGTKHLRELIRCRQEGHGAAVLFVVQMEQAVCLRPNDDTDPVFAAALRQAAAAGVEVQAVCCRVVPGEVTALAPLPVDLSK
ncbi:MAG: DNA/RNA nuclease SfsA [Ruminococcaceae bacterium]|nr:DNA/RNA nuclease SfsA [Oscillospiraceae bacterium]